MMASIKSVSKRRGNNRKPKSKAAITSVEIIFDLIPAEAKLLPGNYYLAKLFGPARKYESFVWQGIGAELVVVYDISSRPFNTVNPDLIVRRALLHINTVLKKLSGGSGGN